MPEKPFLEGDFSKQAVWLKSFPLSALNVGKHPLLCWPPLEPIHAHDFLAILYFSKAPTDVST